VLVPISNADGTVAAPRVFQGERIFEVMVACAKCGVRQTFWGTVPEIGATAEVWQRGHQCAAPPWSERLSGSDERETGRLPGIG
jgi:hypothetical protein